MNFQRTIDHANARARYHFEISKKNISNANQNLRGTFLIGYHELVIMFNLNFYFVITY